MQITLHPKYGANPHMTYCPRCNGEGAEIVLIGNSTSVRECAGCPQAVLTHPRLTHDICALQLGIARNVKRWPNPFGIFVKRYLDEHRTEVFCPTTKDKGQHGFVLADQTTQAITVFVGSFMFGFPQKISYGSWAHAFADGWELD